MFSMRAAFEPQCRRQVGSGLDVRALVLFCTSGMVVYNGMSELWFRWCVAVLANRHSVAELLAVWRARAHCESFPSPMLAAVL